MVTRRSPPPRHRRWSRWVKRGLWLALIGAGAWVIVAGLRPKPLPVDLATAEIAPMRVTVDEDGRTRVKDRYVVSAPIAGRVARIHLDPGADIRRGEQLARIVPRVSPLLDERAKGAAQARVAAARAGRRRAGAEVERANAGLEFARAEATRFRRLATDKIISARQLDEAQMNERAAAAELESARFALRVAEHELEMALASLGQLAGGARGRTEALLVTSPVDGRVLVVHQRSEGTVQPGAALVTVGDPTRLELVVDVLTQDAVRLKPGAEVAVDRWGGPVLEGRVARIEPSAFTRLSALGVEEQRVNVIVELIGDPATWATLGDGYRVETHMTVWFGEAVLTVPASSVFRHDGQWVLYRVRGGIAERTPVKIGHLTGQHVEIAAGVGEGDEVIVHPSDRLQPGMPVVARAR